MFNIPNRAGNYTRFCKNGSHGSEWPLSSRVSHIQKRLRPCHAPGLHIHHGSYRQWCSLSSRIWICQHTTSTVTLNMWVLHPFRHRAHMLSWLPRALKVSEITSHTLRGCNSNPGIYFLISKTRVTAGEKVNTRRLRWVDSLSVKSTFPLVQIPHTSVSVQLFLIHWHEENFCDSWWKPLILS